MTVANPAPYPAVSLMLLIAASKAFVVPLHRLFMLLAVAALPVREIGTACHTAGVFRFPWHHFTSIKKATDGISPSMASSYSC